MNKVVSILLLTMLGCADSLQTDRVDIEAGPPPIGKADNAEAQDAGFVVGDDSGPGTYFSQWDNRFSPASTCQNTTVAMLLSIYGWQGEPDDITMEWGKDYAQSPRGLSNVFNYYAAIDDIEWRLQPETQGTLQDFRERLTRGIPTPVHGYFTGYGHVVLAMGYDGTDYTVMDPAGCWSQVFKGGYISDCLDGDMIRYAKEPFEQAVATSDGYNFLALWFHRLRPE